MGVTVVVNVVVGFKVDIRQEYEEKTKFNEDTGQPYKVNVESHLSAVCDDVLVATSKNNPDQFCGGENIDGLEMFGCGEYGPLGTRWIGVSLARVRFEPGAVDFEFDVPPVVSEFGKKHGLTPKQTLILYMS